MAMPFPKESTVPDPAVPRPWLTPDPMSPTAFEASVPAAPRSVMPPAIPDRLAFSSVIPASRSSKRALSRRMSLECDV